MNPRKLLALVALSTVASATVVVHRTLEEMAQRSPVIVRARVARSIASWDEHKRTIWTWTELTVTDPIKGKPGALVLVKQPGGEIDGIGQAVSGAATFREGDDCVLFLEPAPHETGAFMVTGMAAGKVLMTQWEGLPAAVRDTQGLEFARPAGGGVVEKVQGPEFLGSPESFIQRIRAAAGGVK